MQALFQIIIDKKRFRNFVTFSQSSFISYKVYEYRMAHGWSQKDALTLPSRQSKKLPDNYLAVFVILSPVGSFILRPFYALLSWNYIDFYVGYMILAFLRRRLLLTITILTHPAITAAAPSDISSMGSHRPVHAPTSVGSSGL